MALGTVDYFICLWNSIIHVFIRSRVQIFIVCFFFVVVSFQQFNNMDPQQQFCLKWNSYSSNLAITFSNLFKSDLLADVTLYCGGK